MRGEGGRGEGVRKDRSGGGGERGEENNPHSILIPSPLFPLSLSPSFPPPLSPPLLPSLPPFSPVKKTVRGWSVQTPTQTRSTSSRPPVAHSGTAQGSHSLPWSGSHPRGRTHQRPGTGRSRPTFRTQRMVCWAGGLLSSSGRCHCWGRPGWGSW